MFIFSDGDAPSRVLDVQRNRITVLVETSTRKVIVSQDVVAPDGTSVTVGDWVLLEPECSRVSRILERRTLISRLAAGRAQRAQPIAANIDTLFVVTSCNGDFNPSRLERYLAIARQGNVPVVLVLTKRDLCADAHEYASRARAVDSRSEALAIDATSSESASALHPWLKRGQTVAFVGSSGVGKSTLVNTLLRGEVQLTGAIRAEDARGRHTTTSRQMFELPQGAWVIDTPGMRELSIGAVSDEVLEDVFDDVALLARGCRFRDCAHGGDVGCALESAVAEGRLEPRRLASYLKLRREATRATRTVADQRASERRFGRFAKQMMRDKRTRRDE